MNKNQKTKEKTCAFYASDYHFEMISLPYINKKLDESKEVIVLTENNLKETIKTLVSKINLNEDKKVDILKIDWENNDLNKFKKTQKEEYKVEEKGILVTQEGFDKLEKELDYLKTTKRAEIAEKIKIALGFGDLSENSEYDEAKNAQAENEGKIAELENKIRYAKIIDESEIDTKTVQVGNIVKVYDEEFDEEVTYTIVGSTEVDLSQNKISNESPVGAALLGKKKNQEVEVKVPAGVVKYKILSITK